MFGLIKMLLKFIQLVFFIVFNVATRKRKITPESCILFILEVLLCRDCGSGTSIA